MAALHGKEATIKTGGAASTVTLMNEWTIDAVLAADEITDFGDDWKAFLPGLAEWSGSMSGSFDPSDANGQKAIHDLVIAASPAGASANTLFYFSAANYYSGNIIFTGLSLSTPVAGIITVTITFQGNGALSYN